VVCVISSVKLRHVVTCIRSRKRKQFTMRIYARCKLWPSSICLSVGVITAERVITRTTPQNANYPSFDEV